MSLASRLFPYRTPVSEKSADLLALHLAADSSDDEDSKGSDAETGSSGGSSDDDRKGR